jgi:hypothetical protein
MRIRLGFYKQTRRKNILTEYDIHLTLASHLIHNMNSAIERQLIILMFLH